MATYSFLPIINAFTKAAGVSVELRDISLAGRILAVFPDYLTPQQKQADALSELGELAKTPEANIIKLPNISASIPQMKAAIKELQSQGYKLPEYPEDPQDRQREGHQGPVRQSQRQRGQPGSAGRQLRSPRAAVRQGNTRKHPHKMGAWSPDSKTHVSHMKGGDFRQTKNP